jgi:hypothetical protein
MGPIQTSQLENPLLHWSHSVGSINPMGSDVHKQLQIMKNAVFWDVAPCRTRYTRDLHGVTSQKTAFFIVTAVKTSNLTFTNYVPTT